MSDRIDTDELRFDAAWCAGKLGPVGGGRAARMRAAADEIDRLRAEIDRLRSVLTVCRDDLNKAITLTKRTTDE